MKLLAFLLLATLAHAAQLNVNWTYPSPNVLTGTEVWRAVAGSTPVFILVTTVPASAVSYTDTAVPGGFVYLYKVRGINVVNGQTFVGDFGPVATSPVIPAAATGTTVNAPATVSLTLGPNERIMLSNTTSPVKPNPNDKSIAFSGVATVTTTK